MGFRAQGAQLWRLVPTFNHPKFSTSMVVWDMLLTLVTEGLLILTGLDLLSPISKIPPQTNTEPGKGPLTNYRAFNRGL